MGEETLRFMESHNKNICPVCHKNYANHNYHDFVNDLDVIRKVEKFMINERRGWGNG